jgi:hypothetical protein
VWYKQTDSETGIKVSESIVVNNYVPMVSHSRTYLSAAFFLTLGCLLHLNYKLTILTMGANRIVSMGGKPENVLTILCLCHIKVFLWIIQGHSGQKMKLKNYIYFIWH